MAKKPSGRSRAQSYATEIVTDPAELAALDEQYRKNSKNALYQIGCWNVVDVPLPLLAQYIVELPADDQQEFLNELIERLPADALKKLDESVKGHMDRGAA